MAIFSKSKSELYLGTVAVVPRSAIKKFLEGEWFLGFDEIDPSLKQRLDQIFDLPNVTNVTDPKDTDLGIDVIVTNYLLGSSTWYIDDVFPPIFWRPKVEVVARVYRLSDGRTTYATKSKKKLSFKTYFARAFSFRGVFGFKRNFDSADMSVLLEEACLEILVRVKKHCRF